jgi:hypothetical protein
MANGFTADHRAAFERHGTERVYIAYDRDEAGDKAAAALAVELIRWGSSASVWSSRRAWTRTNTALKVQPAAKSLGVLLNKAEWLGKGNGQSNARGESRRSFDGAGAVAAAEGRASG